MLHQSLGDLKGLLKMTISVFFNSKLVAHLDGIGLLVWMYHV